MGVEGRNLVDLGQGKLHLLCKRGEVSGRKMPVAILDQVQVLDEQIAPARPLAQERAHIGERRRIDLATFGRARRPATAGCGFIFDSAHNNTTPPIPERCPLSQYTNSRTLHHTQYGSLR